MKIIVSDHALVRYLERHRGFNIEQIRNELADLVKPPIAMGARSLAWEGVRFVFIKIKDDIHVSTVLTRNMATKNNQSRQGGQNRG